LGTEILLTGEDVETDEKFDVVVLRGGGGPGGGGTTILLLEAGAGTGAVCEGVGAAGGGAESALAECD
jgi:hypothetical protein